MTDLLLAIFYFRPRDCDLSTRRDLPSIFRLGKSVRMTSCFNHPKKPHILFEIDWIDVLEIHAEKDCCKTRPVSEGAGPHGSFTASSGDSQLGPLLKSDTTSQVPLTSKFRGTSAENWACVYYGFTCQWIMLKEAPTSNTFHAVFLANVLLHTAHSHKNECFCNCESLKIIGEWIMKRNFTAHSDQIVLTRRL